MRAALLALAACAAPAPPRAPLASPHATPAPPRPRWLAVGGEADKQILVARLAGGHVERVMDVPGSAFGWLDPHTLVVLDVEPRGTIVQRYVDGRAAEPLVVTEAEWPQQIFLELVLGNGEIWLKKCVAHQSICDEDHRYLRMFPAPREERAQLPPGAEPRRTIDREDFEPDVLPPETAAPAGFALTVTPQLVTCDDGHASATFPPPRGDDMFTEVVRGARWVSTSPPLYEVALAITNPAGYTHVEHHYVRACGPPLDGYAWLGDGMWASFVLRQHAAAPTDEVHFEGDWTFYAGARVLGTLPGTWSLRAKTE
ncbi:MAG: hypothetical protein ACM31C_27040 [Acidobacteriota bacterium]